MLISETSGRGVPKITSYYAKDSIFISYTNILMIIPLRWIKNVGDKIKINKTPKENNRWNERQSKRHITTINDWNRTWKNRIQNNVIYLKNGLIQHVGSNKTGYWKVKVEQ